MKSDVTRPGPVDHRVNGKDALAAVSGWREASRMRPATNAASEREHRLLGLPAPPGTMKLSAGR